MEPFKFSDEQWNETEQCQEYVTSDMQLRIGTKALMLAQEDPDLMPRRRASIEREIMHRVFELAYRTNTLQEYIGYRDQATLLPIEVA